MGFYPELSRRCLQVPFTLFLAMGAVACSSSPTAPHVPSTPPEVVELAATSHGTIDDSQYKATCLAGLGSPLQISTTCPVLRWGGHDFWAMSYDDNRRSFAIHVFDSSGKLLGVTEEVGARYLYAIDIDETARTVTFRGQSDQTVTVGWDELWAMR